MSDEDKETNGIYRVDTIPPPDGEDDAYSAPTKVGPMADAAVRELMQAAERRAAELNAKQAAAAAATSMETPISVKPVGTLTPLVTAPASDANARMTAPPPSSSRMSSVPRPSTPSRRPSVPRPAAVPRIDPRVEPDSPPPVRLTPPPPVTTAPPPATTAPPPPAAEASTDSPPRLYSDEEDGDADYAATLLHKSARPPEIVERTAVLTAAQNPVTRLMTPQPPPVMQPTPSDMQPPPSVMEPPAHSPSVPPPVTSVRQSFAPAPREPIPFEPFREPPPPSAGPRLMLPLAVSFLIFAIGLAIYVWSR